MIFTRTRDGAVLDATVSLPFTQNRTSRNIVRPLAESDYTVVVYVDAALRTGELRLTFASYAGANAARDFFLAPSAYEFRGAETAATGYVVQDGYIVLAGSATDGEMALRFSVPDKDLTVARDRLEWALTVPYQEEVEL